MPSRQSVASSSRRNGASTCPRTSSARRSINAVTYAICKADPLLRGEGEAADNIVGDPEHSTLSNDAFPTREFDFIPINPPYGKSWKPGFERMGGKNDRRDLRRLQRH